MPLITGIEPNYTGTIVPL